MAAGIDVLHISSGGNAPAQVPVGPGYQVPFAAQVKAAVAGMTTPGGGEPVVVAVGLITEAAQAEQTLITDQADAVAVGRPALRDPYLPVRWAHDLGVNDWEAAGCRCSTGAAPGADHNYREIGRIPRRDRLGEPISTRNTTDLGE